VRYPKGIEGREYYEEELDVIGIDALKTVVLAVHTDRGDGDDGSGDTDDDDSGGGGGREMLCLATTALKGILLLL